MNDESFVYVTHSLINELMFILSFIYCGLEFLSVNHNLINENSELKVVKNIIFLGDISNNWPKT